MLCWQQCQHIWLSLHPIMTNQSFQPKLPVACRRFLDVDGVLQRLISTAQAKARVLLVTADEQLLPTLSECLKTLESVRRDVQSDMETKRALYPRLHTISSDSLLQWMSDMGRSDAWTRTATHIPCLFPSISSLRMAVEKVSESSFPMSERSGSKDDKKKSSFKQPGVKGARFSTSHVRLQIPDELKGAAPVC